nr:immunoglobulin heavy chain junction region [Mus musculus]
CARHQLFYAMDYW